VSPAPGVTVTTGGTLTSPENPSMLALQEVVQEHIKRVGLDVVKDLQQQNSKAAAEGEEPAAAAAIKAAAADAAAAAASAGAGGAAAAAAAAGAQGISSDEVVLSVSACNMLLQVLVYYCSVVLLECDASTATFSASHCAT
jgi:hypothetical protein